MYAWYKNEIAYGELLKRGEWKRDLSFYAIWSLILTFLITRSSDVESRHRSSKIEHKVVSSQHSTPQSNYQPLDLEWCERSDRRGLLRRMRVFRVDRDRTSRITIWSVRSGYFGCCLFVSGFSSSSSSWSWSSSFFPSVSSSVFISISVFSFIPILHPTYTHTFFTLITVP